MKTGLRVGVAAILLSLVVGGGLWLSHRSPKTYGNLSHCKVPPEWVVQRDVAWSTASAILSKHGFKPITQCDEIVIEKGSKLNPATKQWGNSIKTVNGDFWYAGLGSATRITIVGDPAGKPYDRSQAIMSHEVAESILSSNGEKRSDDERNKFLWGVGL